VVSDQFVKHAAETGQRVREYAPQRGGGVQCTVAADDDLLVARLAVDLSTAARVDLSWCDGVGVEFRTDRFNADKYREEGGIGTCVPETRLFLLILTGERWGEKEGLGTIRDLDSINVLVSVIYSGGEGGIRILSVREIANDVNE
jgi:hypothetical protein